MPLFKGRSSKATPHRAIEYITDPNKAATYELLNVAVPPEADANAIANSFMQTARTFGKNGDNDDRKYYHFKFSPDPKDIVTVADCQAAAMELARELFADYECVIATHVDTGVIHSHIIFNSVNFVTGRKFHIDLAEYSAMKDKANEVGLRYDMTPLNWKDIAEERRHILDEGKGIDATFIEKRIILRGGTSWKEELREVIDLAKQECDNIVDFEEYLEHYGVTLGRMTDKTISYYHPLKDRAVRGGRLGDAYTINAIEEAFIKNGEERKPDRADGAIDVVHCWYAMPAISSAYTPEARVPLQRNYVLQIELKLAIRNSALAASEYDEFKEILERDYGVVARDDAQKGITLLHPDADVAVTGAELGSEYEKEAILRVISKQGNGQDGGRTPAGASREGEQRVNEAEAPQQATDAGARRQRR